MCYFVAVLLQWAKQNLVSRGPGSALVRMALSVHARRRGFKLRFSKDSISLRKGQREMLLNKAQFVEVPWAMQFYDAYFDTILAHTTNGLEILDFSRPGLHQYRGWGASFYCPSFPEEDTRDAYTHWYTPQPGDRVWDVGANAGITTFFLSRLVGPNGRVYAFEPDDTNYEYLLRNVELHGLSNVITVKTALARKTGTAMFNMTGTMAAGISEYLVYADRGQCQTVPTISLADAAAQFGGSPAYIKMDVEGAEVEIIQGAKSFLGSHPIEFAIESSHPHGSGFTHTALETLFREAGYTVGSSGQFGEVFTWARMSSMPAG